MKTRLLMLGLIFLGEIIGWKIGFDTRGLPGDGFLRWLLDQEGLASRLIIVLTGALLIQGQFREHPAWISLRSAICAYQRWPLAFVAHAISFGALWFMSRCVFRPDAEDQPAGMLLWCLWSICVVITAFTWLTSVAPLAAWKQAAWDARLGLAGGIVVGITAIVLGRISQFLWPPLSFLTFQSVELLLGPWYRDMEFDASTRIISTPRFALHIADVCSGYEGMGLALVFFGLFLWSFRERLRFPQAFCVIPCGLLIVWILNSVRIAALMVIADQWSVDVAVGGFHSNAGWLAFLAVTLSLAGISLRLPWLRRSVPATTVPAEKTLEITPVVAYVLPFFVLMLTSMLIAVVTTGLESGYFVKVLTVAGTIWFCRARYPHASRFAWLESIACGVLVFVMWCLLEQPDSAAGRQLAAQVIDLPAGQRAWWIAFRVLGSVITVPIAEELAFRGYLMRRVIDRRFDQVAWSKCGVSSLSLSSLLFGLLHHRILAGVLAGLLYGWLARRTAGVAAPIVAHAITNALIAAAVLFGQAWWLWA